VRFFFRRGYNNIIPSGLAKNKLWDGKYGPMKWLRSDKPEGLKLL